MLRPRLEVAEGFGFGIVVFEQADNAVLDALRAYSGRTKIIAICVSLKRLDTAQMWAIPQAGAQDVLLWPTLPPTADQILSRLGRWDAVHTLACSTRVKNVLVGEGAQWRSLVDRVVEMAAFTQASVLITGESGTGKELIARLVHDLDRRQNKGEFVIVDCTTIVPELSGSEFFGHERGAFTGAMNARDGAFAVAHGGTLFLDEIGELPLQLQSQLLRVVQEHKYKRVGSNAWQHTDFRLICATNRDLEVAVAAGSFRGDLYYRIAGWSCRTPPLRERKEDILTLAYHFLEESGSGGASLDLDEAVREYLLTRQYPGNVRDLRRVVARLRHRHVGPGPITIGDVPEEERPRAELVAERWNDAAFESALRRAVEQGVGLREIGRLASETAIRLALEREHDNLHRAASLLGVTDRALQMRRANRRTNR
jgi:transcriptional regulator with GAF, ATPase, and Fis domain